jgi:hypothetical protein
MGPIRARQVLHAINTVFGHDTIMVDIAIERHDYLFHFVAHHEATHG